MHPFTYLESTTSDGAAQAVARNPGAVFFAGGTTLLDLMKLEVLAPVQLVSVNQLPFTEITVNADSITVGANVRNSELAHHPQIRERFPVLSEAILAGASAQLRNMATTAGNILQKTRCGYYRDVNSRCNKREPGAGCDAMTGINRDHAILGVSSSCIATHHSDMCVALAMLDCTVQTVKSDGVTRDKAFSDLHQVPGATPQIETTLTPGELITSIRLAALPFAGNSHYLKVRDRGSYEFALASAAVALDIREGTIIQARIALGGIATKPWRSREAEAALIGKAATTETFKRAAEKALAHAVLHQHNGFKLDLAKRTLVAALEDLEGKQ